MGISTGAMRLEATVWRRDGRARRAGRFGADLEVAFREVDPDSGRAFDRPRQSATGPARRGAKAPLATYASDRIVEQKPVVLISAKSSLLRSSFDNVFTLDFCHCDTND